MGREVGVHKGADDRLTELIKAQKGTVGLNQGAVPGKSGSKGEPLLDPRPTLADAGIDKKLSSRAQAVAAIPSRRWSRGSTSLRFQVPIETRSPVKVATRDFEPPAPQPERPYWQRGSRLGHFARSEPAPSQALVKRQERSVPMGTASARVGPVSDVPARLGFRCLVGRELSVGAGRSGRSATGGRRSWRRRLQGIYPPSGGSSTPSLLGSITRLGKLYHARRSARRPMLARIEADGRRAALALPSPSSSMSRRSHGQVVAADRGGKRGFTDRAHCRAFFLGRVLINRDW
jgi:hypothetical protein